MKINEKNVSSFASSSSPVDKEGYLSKKSGDVKSYQRRWFVLKGNLLFYFEKKQDRDPAGLIVLESCSVQASANERHAFEISFDGPGTRTYLLVADNDEEMQSWMRSVSHASYDFLRSIVNDLQKQLDSLTSGSASPKLAEDTDGGVAGGRGRVPTTKTSVKVENGILVDVEEIPPVPPKRRSKHKLSDNLTASGSSISSSPLWPRVSPIHAVPHSNPVVVNTTDPKKPLSPLGTLDRTPVLTPMVVHADSDSEERPQGMVDNTDLDYDIPPLPVPQKQGHWREEIPAQVLNEQPSSYSPGAVRKLVAPANTSKSVYEMHKEFTDAMLALKTERTGQVSSSGHSGHLPP